MAGRKDSHEKKKMGSKDQAMIVVEGSMASPISEICIEH